ncbi:hypothetical protein DFH28DRAFT_1224809 [Melampsora americana]|nr:hypothetical protein DFH28DRAFT_1224809 [Melampsora americana]
MTMMGFKISIFLPLAIFRLSLITMPLFPVTARPFFDRIGFPTELPDYPEGPIMVDIFSFRPDDVPKKSWSARFKILLGMSGTNRVAMDPGPPQTHIPYYSFYKNAHFFQKKYTQKENQIKELAEKVLKLVDTLDYTSISQKSWLDKESPLVKECQTLAHRALLEPKLLKDLERYWAIGIWVALETGRTGLPYSEIEFPKDVNKQINLEIQFALYHGPTLTKAFDHWVTQKPVINRANGEGLEECLKRAELIGKYEDERQGQVFQPIDKLVSEYLTEPELPQDKDRVSKLLGQFREVFKNMKVHSWEGQYTIAIFRHILNFQSSQIISESLHQALQDEQFWRDLQTPIAQHDVVQFSDILKPFLTRCKLKSNPKLNLYSILKDPSKEDTNLNEAITQMVLELNTISIRKLEFAYKLIMAHTFLRPSLENNFLPTTSPDIIGGLERARSVVFWNTYANTL